MRYEGNDPFERPMRPDRVDMIRQTSIALAEGVEPSEAPKENFAEFLNWIEWRIYDALQHEQADTTVAELRAGVTEAKDDCRSVFQQRFGW